MTFDDNFLRNSPLKRADRKLTLYIWWCAEKFLAQTIIPHQNSHVQSLGQIRAFQHP